jgi:hypothetical protein
MTDTPMKLIVDLSKPEGERETLVPLTADEIADLEAKQEQAQKEELAKQKAEADKAAAKASAIAKLTALGLTENEAKAIIG